MRDVSGPPYTSAAAPAPDLETLLHLLRSEDAGQFLYRGQTRLWPHPLIPSAFRRYQKDGSIYTRQSPQYDFALRKVGRRFAGVAPVNFFHESISLFLPQGASVSSYEVSLLTMLSNNQFLARALGEGCSAFEQLLPDPESAMFRHRFDDWKQIIDNEHRMQIRDMVFMRPFGYLLGQALAQQYGFNSEMLDVTTDPLVAAFFAIHDGPEYRTPEREGTGVIYRFERRSPSPARLEPGAFNFYSCPPVLDFGPLLEPFLAAPGSGDLRKQVEEFLLESVSVHREWRRWEAFRVSPQLLEATRVKRQQAALMVPDEIHVERATEESDRGKVRVLQAVEDLAEREGAMLFCFRHTGDASPCGSITREYLWPNEVDPFFEMIGNLLVASVLLDTGQILPSRIDLLDPGYQS